MESGGSTPFIWIEGEYRLVGQIVFDLREDRSGILFLSEFEDASASGHGDIGENSLAVTFYALLRPSLPAARIVWA